MSLKTQDVPHPQPVIRYGEWGQHISISWEHELVHLGEMKGFVDRDLSVASQKIWFFKTPDSTYKIHFSAITVASNAYNVGFYEKPTILTLGDSLKSFNFNRTLTGSSDSSVFSAYRNGTISDSGKLLAFGIGGGTGGNGSNITSVSGGSRTDTEFNLKYGTIYLLKMNVISSSVVAMNASIYEEKES
jgi:hypothetical protein